MRAEAALVTGDQQQHVGVDQAESSRVVSDHGLPVAEGTPLNR